MKISRIITATLLICVAGIGFAFSQDNSKRDKPQDKKSAAKPVEVKANLLILNADGKFADDVKMEDVKIYEDGAEQKITYFAKKQNAFNVGLVLDNTGSMRPYLDKIVGAGKTIAANLRTQDEAFAVRFVGSDKIEILQDWTADKTVLRNALQEMYIEGGQSAVIDALYLSVSKMLEREKANKSVRSAIILITDGEDRDSFYTKEALLELLKGSDVQIFIIGLTQDLSDKKNESAGVKNSKTNSENLIKSLALETGGAAFLTTAKNDDLIQTIKSVLGELNSQYIVGYTSTNQKRNGNSRKLIVQIADGAKGEKRQPTLRESFIVPEEK